MSKKIKPNGGDRWLLVKGMSTQTQATFKAAAEGREVNGENSLVHEAGTSRAAGGRQLRAVNSGMDDLFGGSDDEDGDSKRRRQKEMGHEGDLDELDFEEMFADDEEQMEVDEKEDEEAKELEVRFSFVFMLGPLTQSTVLRSGSRRNTNKRTKPVRATLTSLMRKNPTISLGSLAMRCVSLLADSKRTTSTRATTRRIPTLAR